MCTKFGVNISIFRLFKVRGKFGGDFPPGGENRRSFEKKNKRYATWSLCEHNRAMWKLLSTLLHYEFHFSCVSKILAILRSKDRDIQLCVMFISQKTRLYIIALVGDEKRVSMEDAPSAPKKKIINLTCLWFLADCS